MTQKELAYIIAGLTRLKVELSRPARVMKVNSEGLACYKVAEINRQIKALGLWQDKLDSLLSTEEVKVH